MDIGIIGSGNMGSVLGTIWAKQGHHGYDAIDAGGLMVSRSLETLATAWVQFAVASHLFPNVGLKALRR